MKQGLSKREKFKTNVIDVLDNVKFRTRLAVAMEVSERTVSNWIRDDNPKLVCDASVKEAMKIMGTLDRSHVTEFVEQPEPATANA